MKLKPLSFPAVICLLMVTVLGCNVCPTKWERERVYNPFPQLKRVAVLPFYNQSGEPTVDTELVAEKYYAALQSVPGFEVVPVGVTKVQWMQYSMKNGEPVTGAQFQDLARFMGVEALVVGSVTDFDAYYPPRMALTVHWYAANEGFHPIPPGYGLPWGTEQQKEIPRQITRETEFELARSQLATQTPLTTAAESRSTLAAATFPIDRLGEAAGIAPAIAVSPDPSDNEVAFDLLEGRPEEVIPLARESGWVGEPWDAPLPANWPDPTDLIPDPPSPVQPVAAVNHEPILSQTRLYRGDDPDFTVRLAHYVESGDDARSGSWQGYLRRSDDFIHFCCHLHIMEMLESRGGRDQSDLILRWPLSRY